MAHESRILLVGGYGHVGKLIAAEISRWHLGKVIIAGRNPDTAKRVANGISSHFEWTGFDALNFGDHEKNVVDQSDVVIVCIDQDNTTFTEFCLSTGKLYLDITAKSNFLAKLDSLNELAIQHKSLAIVSLGLCPGLTNLVAAEVKAAFPYADEIATGLLLCLGESHGRASIEWTLDNFVADFYYCQIRTRPFFDWYLFDFPNFSKKRKAYRFNFSDQHALKKSYNQYDFKTYLCFDSSWVSDLLHLAKRCRVDRVLKFPVIRSVVIRLFKYFSFGKQGFSCECVAIRSGMRVGGLKFNGEHTGFTTAGVVVSALARTKAVEGLYGVKHIHEVLQLEDMCTYVPLKIDQLSKTEFFRGTDRNESYG